MKFTRNMKTTRWRCAIICALLVFVAGCSKIYSTQNEDLQPQISFNNAINDFISIYELIEHINSTKSNLGLKQTNFDTLEKQLNCKLQILDSLTTDGDGYMYAIRFPKLKKDFGSNFLGFDGKARFGTLLVEISQNYRELNTTSSITIPDTTQFYIGSMNNILKKFTGTLKINRNTVGLLNLSFNNVKSITATDSIVFSGKLDVQWASGENNDGILNDIIDYYGDGVFAYNTLPNRNWKTSLALVKNIENGCSANIVKGILQVDDNDNRYRIDFDPFNNMSCDNIAKIYSSGKEYEIRVK